MFTVLMAIIHRLFLVNHFPAEALPSNIGMLTTNEWDSYVTEVPQETHLTGKIFTQRIERNNLRLRTRIKRLARRTICFSRSVEPHEKP